jgi:hypothetical protein
MRRLRLVLVPVFVLGAGLTVSACGGDSSPEVPIVVPTQTTTGVGSKGDFVTQADAVCEEANAAISQFAAAGQGLTEADQIADLRQGVVDELNALGPPDEDRQTLDQFLTATEQMVEAGKKIALAQERGEDTSQFESEFDTARSEAESAASGYGFEECGQPISSSGATDSDSGAVAPSAPVAPAPSDGSAGGTGDTGSGDTGSGDSGGTGGGAGGVGPG